MSSSRGLVSTALVSSAAASGALPVLAGSDFLLFSSFSAALAFSSNSCLKFFRQDETANRVDTSPSAVPEKILDPRPA